MYAPFQKLAGQHKLQSMALGVVGMDSKLGRKGGKGEKVVTRGVQGEGLIFSKFTE